MQVGKCHNEEFTAGSGPLGSVSLVPEIAETQAHFKIARATKSDHGWQFIPALPGHPNLPVLQGALHFEYRPS